MEKSYDIFIKKLDRFVSGYYLNKVLFGLFYFIIFSVAVFLFISFLEYFGWYSANTRKVLFITLILLNLILLIISIGKPILELIKISRGIKREEAGRVLGSFFPEINDKIVNILDLNEIIEKHEKHLDLVLAGIDQKSRFVLPFSFEMALNKKRTRKLFLYSLLLCFLLIGGIIFIPDLFIKPAKRIVQYNKIFVRPSPFVFTLMNTNLIGFQNEDFVIEVKVSGELLPDEVLFVSKKQEVLMEKKNANNFSIQLKNLQEDVSFYFKSGIYNSDEFRLKVYPIPGVKSFEVKISPPSYTGLDVQQLNNISDFVVVEGSKLEWNFYTRFGDVFHFYTDTLGKELKTANGSEVGIITNHKETSAYSFCVRSKEHNKTDSLGFYVQVIKDSYPKINVEESKDSVLVASVFFKVSITDDYGFNKLLFHHRIAKSKTGSDPFINKRIELKNMVKEEILFHEEDFSQFNASPGDVIEYYFEVFDNDGVNGPKSTKSNIFSVQLLDREQIETIRSENSEGLKENMLNAFDELKKIQKESEKLREKILSSPEVNWEDRKALEDLLKKKNELEKTVEQIQEQKDFFNELDTQLSEEDLELVKKKEEIDRLFNELFSEEMKMLFEDIQEKLMELNKEKMNEMLQQMDYESEEMSKQLDRTLELFKKFEVEKMLDESIEKLKDLEKQQLELSIESKQNDSETEKKQELLNKDFDELSNKIDDLKNKAQELEKSPEVPLTNELQKDIQKGMKNASEQLNKGRKMDASKQQKNASEKMGELANQLMDFQKQLGEENLGEDIAALREIMENLLRTSFSQENLLESVKATNVNDPKYPQLIIEQKKIANDLKVIEDSLFSLSKRQSSIESFINREIGDINLNLEKGIEELVGRRKNAASSRQQFVMMHVNNLALMLNESLKQMQNQMSQQQGEGKPSEGNQSGEPSLKSINQMQKNLNDMLEKMQSGHIPEKGPMGEKPSSMSESLAKMAAEQEAIRNQLRKLSDKLSSEGIGDRKALEQLQRDMERTEQDIVNKNISRQTIIRQQSIMTRLLEHEKAEMKREMEEKREGKEAKNYKTRNPEELFKYKRERNKESELLKTVPVGLKPFYKNLVNGYFNKFEE